MDPRIKNLSVEQRAVLLKRLAANRRTASQPESFRRAFSDHSEVDRRPLLSLFAAGELATVDSVSVGCLSDRILERDPTLTARDVTHGLCGDLPVFTNVRELGAGRIASLTLPRFYSQIYSDRGDIVRLVQQCRHVAKLIGAKTVSLTGLIPSATDYGRAVPDVAGLPSVTTGHATTTSAVVLAIRRILRETGRSLTMETLSFVGLGSIGSSTLLLMLKVLPHPRRILLCDVYQKREFVEELIADLRKGYGFQGELSFHHTQGKVPDAIYEGTMLVGATNVPDVVDVDRLAPGTLIVDDSDPHCFAAAKAIERLEQRGDILFTEGGALRAPEPIRHLSFVPAQLGERFTFGTDDGSDHTITGCVLSSLLSSVSDFPVTRGPVNPEDAATHYRGLIARGFDASALHCGSYRIPGERIDTFRDVFGGRLATEA